MTAFWIAQILILCGLVFILAKKEIHTEGKHGWGRFLPTWRIGPGWFQTAFFTDEGKFVEDRKPLVGRKKAMSYIVVRFMGGRTLSGYHLYLALFVFFISHIPLPYVILLDSLTWQWECIMVSLLPLLFLFEDFLWFVLNPEWGIKKFKPGEIEWHPNWLLFVPRDYWSYAIAAGLLIYFGLPVLS